MPPGAPHGLRCEYQVDPLGLGTRVPRFAWRLDDPRPGAVQSAYRLLVASDPARLGRDEGDLWDAGPVASSDTAHAYAGSPLGSRQRGWWKVRSFDGSGEASPWSVPARFELGLLERSDWTARWIASPLMGAPRTPAVVPAVRRSFRVDRPLARARLYVTALGLFEAWLNGVRVGELELAPGWTDYRRRVRTFTFDVTSVVHPGANALGALLGDGWYCGFVGLVGTREVYGRRPALLAQLELVDEGGETARLVSDASWRWRRSPILESDLLMGETLDARQDLGDWSGPDFDASDWLPVDALPDPGIALDATSGPGVRATRELEPVGPPLRRGGRLDPPRFVFDLGQNLVGRVRIRARAPEGTTLRLRHAEMLDERGDLYLANLRDARQTDTFTLRGTGEVETFEPRFTFHGFRYVEVTGAPDADAIVSLTAVVLHSDLPETGEFACSDPRLERLQQNIVWSQRGNFVDVPTDCPQRSERLGWTGDAQVFVRTACFHMQVAGFFRKWCQDLADAQDAEGRVPPVAPRVRLGRIDLPDGGPAWADAMVICPWTIYRWYDDRRLLEERWDAMRAFVDELERRFPHGIRSDPALDPWGGFGDWLALDGTDPRDDRLGGTPKELIGTAFFAHVAGLLARIARVLDRPEDEKGYAELSSRVRDAFRRRFVTPDGLVAAATQTARVLALHFGLLEERERRTTAEALARDVEGRGIQLTTGFVGTPYLLHVLTETGRLDLAYRLLLRTEYPSWLHPVLNGATTIWERWDGWTEARGFQDPEMNSFNHYAYGAVGEWLYGTLAGLDLDPDPEAAGFRRARIEPRPPLHPDLPEPPLLSAARAALETLRGRYEVCWWIEGERFALEARVPPNGAAEVRLPDGRRDAVGAGRHRFEVRLEAIRAAQGA